MSILRSSHEAFLDNEEGFKHPHYVEILADFYTFSQNKFLHQLQLQFSQSFVVLGKLLVLLHKLKTKYSQNMVLDWVHFFWKG